MFDETSSEDSELLPPVGRTDHALGPRDAPVELVEYGDFECPHSERAYWVLEKIQDEREGQILFVYRDFPLVNVHPHAEMAAEAAEAAGAEGRFWDMHALLYRNQPALDAPSLLRYALALELDLDYFVGALRDGRYRDRVARDIISGHRSGVEGTPTFFINGKRYRGSYAYDELSEALDEAREQRTRTRARNVR